MSLPPDFSHCRAWDEAFQRQLDARAVLLDEPDQEQAATLVAEAWEAAAAEVRDFAAQTLVSETRTRQQAAEREQRRAQVVAEQRAETAKEAKAAWRTLYGRRIAGQLEPFAAYSERSVGVAVALDGSSNSGNASDGPAGARDQVLGDVEDVFGGSGNDSLTGNGAENLLDGGFGDDLLNSRDASADLDICGPGIDTATIDEGDQTDSCESELIGTTPPSGTPVPPHTTPPPTPPDAVRLTLKLPSRQSLRTVLSKGLVVRAGCTASCTLAARLLMQRVTARRLGLAAAQAVIVGRATRTLHAAGNVRLTIKLTRRARKALRRVPKLKLTLRLTATSNGTSQTITRRLALTRTRLASSSASSDPPRDAHRSADSNPRSTAHSAID